ncbi:hypothetical protein AB0901_31020 [Streptomyces roseifaciens]
MTIPTRDGGTMAITRRGALVDVHLRDREGRTVATVVRRAGPPLPPRRSALRAKQR